MHAESSGALVRAREVEAAAREETPQAEREAIELALVQVAWRSDDGQQVALIDPLAVDVGPFGTLFASESLCVIHAAQQDIDVLTHAVGAVPARMFDTQIAAGFLGYGTPSLSALLNGEIGVNPGPMMAAADRVTIEITGRGGHGAHAYMAGGPVLVAAHIITAAQSVVSRVVV